MKKTLRRVLTVVLTLAIVAGMVPQMNQQKAQAATKSVTMYAGEAWYVTNYSTVTSVKSSKKSVVAASKDSENTSHADLIAKKAGKSTVTVKTSSGTMKYVITVKKAAFSVSLEQLPNGYVMFAVKNKTGQTFDDVTVTYTLKGADGAELKTDTVTVNSVLAKKVAYAKRAYDSYSYTIDISQCSGKVTALSRSTMAKYKDISSKVKTTVTEQTANSSYSSTVEFTVKTKNKSSLSASGTVYVLCYDASNNLIGLQEVYLYLKGSGADTDTTTLYLPSGTTLDHYTTVTRAYSRTY